MTESLLERQDVVAAVARCLGRARDGRGGALFVVGEAGLGKTAVLRRARELAGESFEVRSGRADPMETTIPFGLAAQVLDRLGPTPVGPGSETDRGADPIGSSGPYLRTLEAVRARAGSPPLLLVLDDLHCADYDSIRMIAFLVRRLAREPVVVIGALRPWPPAALEAVRGLEGSGAARLVRLEPLSPDSAAELLKAAAGVEAASDLRDRALRLCGGNPLLIRHLGEAIGRGDGVPRTGLGPESPAPLLLSRFAGLDPAAMRLARCASVIGDRFRVDVACATADLGTVAEQAALEALCGSSLMVDADRGRMRFVHPLFRQALYEEMPAAVRRRLHRQAFAHLAARGLDERAADQAIKGDMVGSQAAAELLERVGRTAIGAGAIATAAVNLEAAIRFRGSTCSAGLLATYAEVLLALARVGEATEVGRRLLALPDLTWLERVAALRTLGQADYLAGSADLGDDRMDAAVELAVEHDPRAAIYPLLAHASIAWMAHGPAAALAKVERARELAAAVDDSELREPVDTLWGHLAVECGNSGALETALSIGRRLERDAGRGLLDPAELTWPASAIYGYAHCEKYAERFDRSAKALRFAREALQRAGEANGIATVTIFIAKQLVWQGYLEVALAEADRAEEFSELTPVALPFISLVRAEALAHRGRLEESERHRLAALERSSDRDLWLVRLWSGLVLGTRLFYEGDQGASDEFLEVERVANTVGLLEPSSQPWAGRAVEAHLAAGRTDDALRVTSRLEQSAENHPARWPRAIAGLSRSRVHESMGERDAAEAGFREAVELLREVDLPLERALALFAQGGFHRRAGRAVEARTPLAEALALAESIGADHLAGEARSELRLAGGRRRRRSEDRDLITPAELRVAREAARGRTNAEIAARLHLSTNTVHTHLKRIYAKLEISSRRELSGIDLQEQARL